MSVSETLDVAIPHTRCGYVSQCPTTFFFRYLLQLGRVSEGELGCANSCFVYIESLASPTLSVLTSRVSDSNLDAEWHASASRRQIGLVPGWPAYFSSPSAQPTINYCSSASRHNSGLFQSGLDQPTTPYSYGVCVWGILASSI